MKITLLISAIVLSLLILVLPIAGFMAMFNDTGDTTISAVVNTVFLSFAAVLLLNTLVGFRASSGQKNIYPASSIDRWVFGSTAAGLILIPVLVALSAVVGSMVFSERKVVAGDSLLGQIVGISAVLPYLLGMMVYGLSIACVISSIQFVRRKPAATQPRNTPVNLV